MSLRDKIGWEIVQDAKSLDAMDDGSMNDIIDAVLRALTSANFVVVDKDHYSMLNESHKTSTILHDWEDYA